MRQLKWHHFDSRPAPSPNKTQLSFIGGKNSSFIKSPAKRSTGDFFTGLFRL